MARLADLLEDYRNLIGRANWSIGRDIDAMSGYDPDLAEFVERSSLGTGSHGLGAGGLAGMIKASHGSPHAFTKFDLSKIGTGEGAQAYGHGGYFAQGFDSPVANMYADALGSKNQDLVHSVIDRVVKTYGGDTAKIKSELLNAGLPGERITPELETTISRIVKGTDPSDNTVSNLALNEYRYLENLVPNEKHLYNVELKWPDAAREASDPLGEHHLLDWDAPLSEQPPIVRNALSGLNLPAGTYGENPPRRHRRARLLRGAGRAPAARVAPGGQLRPRRFCRLEHSRRGDHVVRWRYSPVGRA